MNYSKEKDKIRSIWKVKRKELFSNSSDLDNEFFLKN